MTLEQIHQMRPFDESRKVTTKSLESTRQIMRDLYEGYYVKQPTANQRHRVPAMVYWLDRYGVEYISDVFDIPHLRVRKLPGWHMVEHEIGLNDARIAAYKAIEASPDLRFEAWVNEKTIHAWHDRVSWKNTAGQRVDKEFAPDGHLSFSRRVPGSSKEWHNFALLIELDNASRTVEGTRQLGFADTKILPGLAFLESKIYKQRFGIGYGYWAVIVAAGQRRMLNLAQQAERVGAKPFLFATLESVTQQSIFNEPIWWKPGASHPEVIFDLLLVEPPIAE